MSPSNPLSGVPSAAKDFKFDNLTLCREEGIRIIREGHVNSLRKVLHAFGANTMGQVAKERLPELLERLKLMPEPEPGGLTWAERKRLASFRSIAVIVQDQELGCSRVTAFHSSLPDALDTARKTSHWQSPAVYIRHDFQPEPIAGDYQI